MLISVGSCARESRCLPSRMPGLPFPNHDAANNGCQFSYPRSADQTCCQQSRARFSPDEQLTPEESFALYCKPVELYNIIQQRAIKNPPSLQRCLHYKIDAKRKKSHLLLQRREFFHPQKAQRMEPEEVFADHDSEDKVDDDIADFEDRRMLDDFVDVSKDEKRIMHTWNSFVRKQRVLADGHIPWACEAFSRQHGQQFVHNPALLWSWRFFMIKLWNHSLLDARTMNTCNMILDGLMNESSGPKQICS